MFGCCLSVTAFLIATIIALIYLYFTWNFNYWKKRGVNGPKPKILSGTFPSMLSGNRNMYYDFLDIYNEFKSTNKIVGVFTVREPELMLLDPGLVHEVYVTKFKYFNENSIGQLVDKKTDKIFGRNPFVLNGEEWKEIRNDVVPALTANRIKASYPVMLKTFDKLKSSIDRNKKMDENHVFDAKAMFCRYTVETVADCIFGIEAGAFNENAESPIYQASQALLADFLSSFTYFFISSVVPILRWFHATKIFSEKTENFFLDLTERAIKLRLANPNDRCDFMNYAIQLKEKKKLNYVDITAQVMTFFTDGFETSSVLITHCALMLGRNKDIQDKLRQEIMSNLDQDGILSFEKLNEMPYLDAVIQETLRIISPLLFNSKRCSQTCELDNNGKSIRIDKGMVVHIPIQCFHSDESLYENADEFRPERFLKENQAKKWREEGKFLAFGDGPRICLGMKFGLTQSKSAICGILRNYKIIVDKKTRKDNFLSKQDLIPMIEGGVWLRFKDLE